MNSKCAVKFQRGIQKIPDSLPQPGKKGYVCDFEDYKESWGNHRVPLIRIALDKKSITEKKQDAKACVKRGSFYIHDSTKSYTHGCVEVDPAFFTQLYKYDAKHPKQRNLVLKVHYASAGTGTDGGTKK